MKQDAIYALNGHSLRCF